MLDSTDSYSQCRINGRWIKSGHIESRRIKRRLGDDISRKGCARAGDWIVSTRIVDLSRVISVGRSDPGQEIREVSSAFCLRGYRADDGLRLVNPSALVVDKEKVLFLRIGPPSVPPN